ncbi:MAG: ATPase, T2SS/T4P/T4SS family [Candidatus Diapherotrites archaeon]
MFSVLTKKEKKEKKEPITLDNPEDILGFGLIEFNIVKTMKKEERHSIGFNHENELLYAIDFPLVSNEEAWLAKQVLNEFRKKTDSEKKNFPARNCLDGFLEENLLSISKQQKEYLIELIELNAFRNGLMQFLLDDNALEEIALIGTGKEKPVHVFHRIFGWMKTNLFYSNEMEAINLINKLARKTGRQVSFQKPQINAVLENGNRLNACISPVAFSGASITIRKFSQKPFTPIDLIKGKTCSAELISFLEFAMKTDLSLLVCGNTGSGKTSFLNAIFLFVPKNERIIIIEETPEINCVIGRNSS